MIGKEIDILEYSNINYIFTGYLDEEDIIQYYAKTHINIIPTLADNLPNTILESLSCGTPVVSFDTGGCKDLVKHFETGYLSKYNDTEDFVNGIVFFIENKGNLVKYSFNARKFVERHFTMEIQTEKYISLIKEVMDET